MRKRRRLANKMTIMVCAVLLAVSAFFYAPMDVEAAENSLFSVSGSGAITFNYGHGSYVELISLIDDTYDLETYYELIVNYDFLVDFRDLGVEYGFMLRNAFFSLSDIVDHRRVTGVSIANYLVPPDEGSKYIYSRFAGQSKIVAKGSDLLNKYLFFDSRSQQQTLLNCNFTYSLDVLSINPLTGEESASYQQGYNTGYSAGEEAGESNGYSSGYSDGYNTGYGAGKTNGYESGYEQGSNDGYNSGFQAGVDSVDTQSYYDAGYQTGYDTGYATGYDTGYDEGFSTGYDEGYDSGYAKAMSRLENAGTDINNYPILLGSANNSDWGSWMIPVSIDNADLQTVVASYDDSFVGSINPNHTYKLIGTVGKLDFVDNFGYSTVSTSELWLNIGGHDYLVKSYINGNQLVDVEIYMPGDSITSNFAFQAIGYNVSFLGSNTYTLLYCDFEYNLQLYDMGPSGDTQNHIANQTDQLTNGYDDSKGNTVNSELSTGLNEFEIAENSLFATATTGMKDFTFFDFESVPAMLTAVTFITSIMGSWFEQAGGASGVGIVLSILFSVMLVSMVLGLYRLYQSAGHRAEARERHRQFMEHWKKGK